jgi:ribonucleoside-triphosphate reductase (thioredoxin)
MVQPTQHRAFYLSDTFIDEFKGSQPKWGPLGYVTYKRTYARKRDDGTTEEFCDTLRRVVEGTFNMQKTHIIKNSLSWNNVQAQRTAQAMYRAMWDFRFLPAGRGLWANGTNYAENKTAAALFNCAMISTNDIAKRGPEIYEFIMDALMLGVGVGFDTLGTGKLEIQTPEITNGLVYSIPDTREGWVESVGLILNAYFNGGPLPTFEYDQIRAYGEPIKGFGGTASGPEPLIVLHTTIQKHFEGREGEEITSSDIVDIENYISKCVIAGNVRRSAALALGDPLDKEYMELKHDEEKLKSHRYGSNNAIACTIGMDYSEATKNTIKQGEPGYLWLENARWNGRMGEWCDDSFVMGVNPCGEIFLESGELCNLVETFPANHETLAEYKRTLKLAYLYAKTMTLAKTHWPETNAKMLKNRRIGVSQSGIIQAFRKHGRREMLKWSDESYKHLRELDKIFSDWMAIPTSKKITTVKPSGTVSLLCGATPGIHYPENKYYIRRIRFSNTSELIPILREAGYKIEDDVYDSGGKTLVVEFPVEEQFYEKSKYDVTLWEQLENTAQYQQYWADNAVSNTITFQENEKKDLPRALELYETRLKSASFLPLGTHSYEQAPYEAITKEQYIEMKSNLKELDFSSINIDGKGLKYCDGDNCTITT